MPADEAAVARLRLLAHIVVVMMENRSFDHMLGFLSLEGMADVEGLTGREFNADPDGHPIYVHAFDARGTSFQPLGEALQKRLDPDHSAKGVQVQLGPGYGRGRNGGFVKSFIESRKSGDNVSSDEWIVPMGYYTSKDVPVYDHLARQYCVCDRWYSAVPGDTWPNRLHAVCGRAGPRVQAGSPLLDAIAKLPFAKKLRNLPLYDMPAFTRQLEDRQWRWYAHDPATLRLTDAKYRNLDDPRRDQFAFFDRRKVSWLTEFVEGSLVRDGSFLDHAAHGKLPQVSWIDPNFIDVRVLETSSNDDHPPSDIRAGQAFILDVYDALRRSPAWGDTMLIVTYDEHGGFFDHVPPPALDADLGEPYATWGVRVPALIAGPRVRRGVLHDPPADGVRQPRYEHATLIKTILAAFAEDPATALAAMPERVRRAPHLGSVLLDAPRTDIDDPRNARELMTAWRSTARRERVAARLGALPTTAADTTRSAAPDGAGQPLLLSELQSEYGQFAATMRSLGVEV